MAELPKQIQQQVTHTEKGKITVSIDPMGNAQVEAFGYKGGACVEATEAIEKAIAGGAGKAEREFKDDWLQPEEQGQRVDQSVKW